jgi:hypothetical protein
MTSQINFIAIDENYPVAGKDNDSQGFRDNFNSIKAGMSVAKAEITKLQASALLSVALDTTSAVDNDLAGSSINNGFYNNFYGTVRELTANSATAIDVSAASLQVFTLLHSIDFTFRNWPASGYYGKVTVHFKSDGSGVYLPSLFSEGGGVIKPDNNFPDPLSVGTDGKHHVVEAWTYDGGNTVFIKYLGSF